MFVRAGLDVSAYTYIVSIKLCLSLSPLWPLLNYSLSTYPSVSDTTSRRVADPDRSDQPEISDPGPDFTFKKTGLGSDRI